MQRRCATNQHIAALRQPAHALQLVQAAHIARGVKPGESGVPARALRFVEGVVGIGCDRAPGFANFAMHQLQAQAPRHMLGDILHARPHPARYRDHSHAAILTLILSFATRCVPRA